ncbi:MAG TPA: RdgB/HAM1 family non-canonical purine NTP pyrophosphatase [Clostridia bacterium]|jgi:XTP/dITP diphosphohydrolase|nr:RdgB/HAM1 family non-canonical purine NTP pyrophosphatase [Clostridiaceae bacterium]HOA30702.1 RdgB/HAM1 family non-canonical purine NTP pyrophosphatase [Clostridia bacterium]HPZ52048.1 RdgB/HAM1 family non-canonical purine NTP pyrophosphatase [Clostridia bacterium]
MLKVVLATQNNNKVREMQSILKDCGVSAEVISAKDAGVHEFPEENGTTFSENAYIKAKGIFDVVKKSGILQLPYLVIADDSGLCVDALEGRPGIYSARYASVDGNDAADEDNIKKLLMEMEGIPNENRKAYFECSIAAIRDDGKIFSTQGRLHGYISLQPVGCNGFGYDPVFYLPEESCTVAQLDSYKKNRISHRAKAIRSLAEIIKDNMGGYNGICSEM